MERAEASERHVRKLIVLDALLVVVGLAMLLWACRIAARNA
jgi:hypothetical protein